jgi:hypothetical protein
MLLVTTVGLLGLSIYRSQAQAMPAAAEKLTNKRDTKEKQKRSLDILINLNN